ncbi:MAG: dimethyladenosine transferase [Actinobacteria bacterium]|nr:dimethyladenosine transferase [Actinomycetota bacterium]
MPQVEVVDTGSAWIISRSIVVRAPAQGIFDILANPRRHPDFDGSGSVRVAISGPERLSAGAKFGMSMRLGVPYRVSSQVKEFDEGRLIAWAHLGGHRWRYVLEPLADGSTRVTETFDATTARSARALKLMDAYNRNTRAIEETLPRLAALAESETR